jgi:addiction module HigA family antidote
MVNMVKNGLPAIHPGEFLTEILGEMGISQAEFARAIGVSPMRISHIVKGDRPVTAELALLFGRAFNTAILAQSSGKLRSQNREGEHR